MVLCQTFPRGILCIQVDKRDLNARYKPLIRTFKVKKVTAAYILLYIYWHENLSFQGCISLTVLNILRNSLLIRGLPA